MISRPPATVRADGCPAPNKDMGALFDRWDLDKSGFLSLIELHRILRRGGTVKTHKARRSDAITQEEIRTAARAQGGGRSGGGDGVAGSDGEAGGEAKYAQLAGAIHRARLNFVAQAMGIGQATSKDLIKFVAQSAVHATSSRGGGGSGRASPTSSPGKASPGRSPPKHRHGGGGETMGYWRYPEDPHHDKRVRSTGGNLVSHGGKLHDVRQHGHRGVGSTG